MKGESGFEEVFSPPSNLLHHPLSEQSEPLSRLLSMSVPKMDIFPLMLSTFSYVRDIRIGGMRKFFIFDASHEALCSFYSSHWGAKA
jgi:hypothetical protein